MRIVEETATRIRRGRLDAICRVAYTPAIREQSSRVRVCHVERVTLEGAMAGPRDAVRRPPVGGAQADTTCPKQLGVGRGRIVAAGTNHTRATL